MVDRLVDGTTACLLRAFAELNEEAGCRRKIEHDGLRKGGNTPPAAEPALARDRLGRQLDQARSAVEARTTFKATSSLDLNGGATDLEIGRVELSPQQCLKLGHLDAANLRAMALPQLTHTRQCGCSGNDLIDGWTEDRLNDRGKTAQPIAGVLVDAVVLQALGQFGRDGQLESSCKPLLRILVPDIGQNPLR